MSALDALVQSLPRTAFVAGKGGVGKTTIAAALAATFAERGDGTLLVSTDPAAALASVLGSPVGAEATPVQGVQGLTVRQLDAASLRHDFLERWRNTIAEIIDRGTYLDRAEIDGIVDAALPGADEVFALLALADLLASGDAYQRIIVDTAPTGHTLRLLALPDTFSALLSMLDLMQDKHRFMVRTLTRRYRSDAADAFIAEMRGKVDRLRAALSDAQSVAAIVVTRDEPVVRAETVRYVEQLRGLHVRVAAVVVNAASERPRAVIDADVAEYVVGVQSEPPVGIAALRRTILVMDEGTAERQNAPKARAAGGRREAEDAAEARSGRGGGNVAGIARTLTIVGGKGGVGKSTAACAIAIAAVDADQRPTLLVSTDPAPSLADALGESDAEWAHEDVEYAPTDVPGLMVRQMDATTAFARLRDEYQNRIDDLFAALVGGGGEGGGVGVDLERDRAIVRDLLALAPPGIDELYALSVLGDALYEGRFQRIVVDPAPTGHLLRLLDMPAIALDWSHRLMRLMLEYRNVVSLGDTAQELLNFAKRTRVLDALLHDASRSSLVIVALDEPVVRAETERLAGEVQTRRIDVGAIVWNRVRRPPDPLPAVPSARQLFADEVTPPPIGVAAIRAWSGAWSPLSSHS